MYLRMGLEWLSSNDVNNQQDATNFSFINLFKSAQYISGDNFTHPQEHFFDRIYSFWYNAPTLLPTGWQRCRCIVPKAVYAVKKVLLRMGKIVAETCLADLKRLINEKVVASCCLFTSLY